VRPWSFGVKLERETAAASEASSSAMAVAAVEENIILERVC
jgi:hypothetical protein